MKILVSILVPLFAAAIMASAKAIVDVQVLKAENMTTKDIVKEIKQDVRDIRKHLLGD